MATLPINRLRPATPRGRSPVPLPPTVGKGQPNPGAPAGTLGRPTAGAKPSPASPCLISWPTFSPFGLSVLSVGGGCILSKTNVRAMAGGVLLALGGVTVLVGTVILAAYGLKAAGAARAVGGSLEAVGGAVALVPGAQAAGAGIAAAGAGTRKAAGRGRGAPRAVQRQRARASADARYEREMGGGRENPQLRTGRGAIRETPAGTRRRQLEAASDTPPF